MKCYEARRLRPMFLALELTSAVEDEVRDHIALCPGCRAAFVDSEPVFALSWKLRSQSVETSTAFVDGVMAGIRQRRFERRVGVSHRFRWGAAAAAVIVLTVATSITILRDRDVPSVNAAEQVAAFSSASEPAFVEVEGEDVRVYHIEAGGEDPIQVAFVIDPRMEL